jgi:hypothetical protein
MQLPGHGPHRDGNNSFPNPILWGQRNIAGTQDLFDQEGDGAYPYGFFFQPPAVPAAPNPLIPWSGLPPAGGFTPFTPFMLPATYYISPSFPTNQGNPGGYGLDGGGGGVSVIYDDGTTLVTVDDVTTLDFGNWTYGFVYENPVGSGIITIDQPSGTGTTGNLTVNTGDTAGTGPLVLVSGSSFGGNITLGLNYETTNSFNSSSTDLRLKSITTTSSVLGTDELISQVTTDGFGRFTDYKKINVDTTDSFNSTVSSGDLALKGITPPVTAQAIDSGTSTRITTILAPDSKARVQSQTTRDIGMFIITKADRVDGEVFWTYTLRRFYDSDATVNPITTFPFGEGRSSTYTAYNGLEVANTAGSVYGLNVLSTAGTAGITLTGTYQGFTYDSVPIGTVVMAMKEGNVNAKWWFTAPNMITGVCPEP